MSGVDQHPPGRCPGPAPLLSGEPAAGPDGEPAQGGHTKVLHPRQSGKSMHNFCYLIPKYAGIFSCFFFILPIKHIFVYFR